MKILSVRGVHRPLLGQVFSDKRGKDSMATQGALWGRIYPSVERHAGVIVLLGVTGLSSLIRAMSL